MSVDWLVGGWVGCWVSGSMGGWVGLFFGWWVGGWVGFWVSGSMGGWIGFGWVGEFKFKCQMNVYGCQVSLLK